MAKLQRQIIRTPDASNEKRINDLKESRLFKVVFIQKN